MVVPVVAPLAFDQALTAEGRRATLGDSEHVFRPDARHEARVPRDVSQVITLDGDLLKAGVLEVLGSEPGVAGGELVVRVIHLLVSADGRRVGSPGALSELARAVAVELGRLGPRRNAGLRGVRRFVHVW